MGDQAVQGPGVLLPGAAAVLGSVKKPLMWCLQASWAKAKLRCHLCACLPGRLAIDPMEACDLS
jgi:hypothetical protein